VDIAAMQPRGNITPLDGKRRQAGSYQSFELRKLWIRQALENTSAPHPIFAHTSKSHRH